MDWSFGLASNEIMATALGFAVQDRFFKDILNQSNYLNELALAFGLIGFTTIMLTLGRLRPSQLVAWAFLFLVVIVRPFDGLFFTTLDENAAPALQQTPAIGGTLTQDEFNGAFGDVQGVPTYCDRMKEAGLECLTAFTPQLAIVSALNGLNIGLAKEYLPPGRRLLEGYQPAISSLAAGRLASNASNFHLSQYLQTCTGEGSGAAERLAATYVPFGQLEKQDSQDVIDALQAKQVSAYDAWRLLLTYDAYAQSRQQQPGTEMLLPPLICPAEGCAGQGAVTVKYPDVFSFVLKDITAHSGDDFTRVRDKRQEIIFNVQSSMPRLDAVEGIIRRLKEQPVTLAMPLNANAIAASIKYENAADGAATGTDIGAAMSTGLDYAASGGGGCAAGAIAGGAIGATVGGITAGPAALIGCGIGALVGTGTRAAQGRNIFVPAFDIKLGEGSARQSGGNTERAYLVRNCADFHQLTDARLFVDTALANRLTETLAQVLKSGDVPADFSQMSLEQQAMVGLHSALASQQAKCAGYDAGFNGKARAACEKTAGKNIGELIAYAQTMAANNALPELMGAAHAENARETRFPSKAHELIAAAGGYAAPIGLAFKSTIGGFAAGTYAAIMPVVVTFGTALTIMLTPFLYMIGLMVPHWSLNVVLLPLIGVAYFQLVKVIFTIINIFGKTFIEASDLNLLTGSGEQFPTIILSYAYTSAFILSAGLLYALRNPAAIIQNIASKADRAAQFGWAEVAAIGLAANKGVGAVAKGVNPTTLGQVSGAIQNIKAGRNTISDRFNAAELATITKGEETTMKAAQHKGTTYDDRDQLQSRGKAHALDDLAKRAREEAQGRGLEAKYRQPSGATEPADAPFMALAKVYKDNGGNERRGVTIANKMFAQKAADVVTVNGSRYLQFDPSAIQRMNDREAAQFFDRIKDKLDTLADKKTGKAFSHILKDIKL